MPSHGSLLSIEVNCVIEKNGLGLLIIWSHFVLCHFLYGRIKNQESRYLLTYLINCVGGKSIR